MNRNVKIAIGVILGAGLIYLGYRYLYKGKDSKDKGSDTSSENIIYDKASRKVVLVTND